MTPWSSGKRTHNKFRGLSNDRLLLALCGGGSALGGGCCGAFACCGGCCALAGGGGGGCAFGAGGGGGGACGGGGCAGGAGCCGAFGGFFLDGLGEGHLTVGDLGEAEDGLGLVPLFLFGQAGEALGAGEDVAV